MKLSSTYTYVFVYMIFHFKDHIILRIYVHMYAYHRVSHLRNERVFIYLNS